MSCKRSNKPGISTTDRVPKGGPGGHYRGASRGGMMRGAAAYNPYLGGFRGRAPRYADQI